MTLEIYENDAAEEFSKYLERSLLNSYDQILFSEEAKNKIRSIDSKSLFYVAPHKSHLDYLVILTQIFNNKLPYPYTISGNNLLSGPINWFFEYMLKHEPEKFGAVGISRGKNSREELETKIEFIRKAMLDGEHILEFPEAGRSYKGEIKPFKPGLLDGAIRAAKESNDIYFVPISVSYDFMAEGPYVNKMNLINSMKNIDPKDWKFLAYLNEWSLIQKTKLVDLTSRFGKIPISLLGKTFYSIHETVFFTKAMSLGKGNVYLDVGNPIHVKPDSNRKKMAELLRDEVGKIYRVNRVALTAKSIIDVCNNKRYPTFNWGEMVHQFWSNYNYLKKKECNLNEIEGELSICIDRTIADLKERNVIYQNNAIKKGKIQYYANTINHLFE